MISIEKVKELEQEFGSDSDSTCWVEVPKYVRLHKCESEKLIGLRAGRLITLVEQVERSLSNLRIALEVVEGA